MPLNYTLLVPPAIEPVSISLAKKQLRVDISDDDFLIETYISVAREYCEEYTNRAFYPQTWQLSLDSFPYGDYRSTVPIDQRSPWNYSAYWSDLAIRLPKPMCIGVTSLTYVDGDGNNQSLASGQYYVDLTSKPCRIVPIAGATWPVTQFYQPGSIQVVFQAASYQTTLSQTVTVAPASGTETPYLGTLSNQVLSITSVKDVNGNTLTYTPSLVTDQNGDSTSQTQLSFATAPPSNQVGVVYQGSIIPKTIIAAMLLIIGHLYENREQTTALSLKTLPLGVENFLKTHVFQNFGNYRSGY